MLTDGDAGTGAGAKTMGARAIDFFPLARESDVVVMGVYPDGQQCRITGQRRAEAWTRGTAIGPESVRVITVAVADDDDAARLYDEFEHLLGSEMM
jgi:hypothetical protein